MVGAIFHASDNGREVTLERRSSGALVARNHEGRVWHEINSAGVQLAECSVQNDREPNPSPTTRLSAPLGAEPLGLTSGPLVVTTEKAMRRWAQDQPRHIELPHAAVAARAP